MTKEEKVTQKIVRAIERGTASFQMPWHSMSKAVNGLNNHPYQGINALILSVTAFEEGYTSNQWATYKVWNSVGRQVKRGETGTDATYFDYFVPKDQKQLPEEEQSRIGFRKFFMVFNQDQLKEIEGESDYAVPAVEKIDHGDNRCSQVIEDLAESVGAKIAPNGKKAIFYRQSDEIHMPNKEAFVGTKYRSPDESYAHVLAHELVHWTGHSSRLDRKTGTNKRSPEYAFEELVAELGSVFLCSNLQFQYEGVEDHAGYIESWLRILNEDSKAIFRASSQAMRAKNFLLSED